MCLRWLFVVLSSFPWLENFPKASSPLLLFVAVSWAHSLKCSWFIWQMFCPRLGSKNHQTPSRKTFGKPEKMSLHWIGQKGLSHSLLCLYLKWSRGKVAHLLRRGGGLTLALCLVHVHGFHPHWGGIHTPVRPETAHEQVYSPPFYKWPRK